MRSSATATTRYAALAEQLAKSIRDGTLRPGDRLPSVRQLCVSHDMSPITVQHALHLLEDQGLIESRPRAGFFVSPEPRTALASQDSVEYAQFLALNEKSELTLEFAQRRDGDRLGILSFNPALYPLDQIRKIMTDIMRRYPESLTAWQAHEPGLGANIARRAIDYGCNFAAGDVLITHGTVEGMALSLRAVTSPGDTVLIAVPCEFELLETVSALRLRAVEITTDADGALSVDAIAAELDKQAIAAFVFTSMFLGPMRSIMPDAEKAALVALFAERNIPLIEGDPYTDLHFGPKRPKPFKAFDEQGIVLYCGDLGLLICPGLQLGYIVAERHRRRLELLQKVSCEMPPPLLQKTAARFMDGSGFERHLRQLRRQLHEQTHALAAGVRNFFPPAARIVEPIGAQLLWIEMPTGFDAVDLQRRAKADDIVFGPGVLFSFGDGFRNCLRLNTGHSYDTRTESCVRRLGELAAEMLAR
ncbi:MAG TPA: PLP-dependent aminotransferase family protein [Paucimonas sp.]|nr:PLP-dependent aminotransferase family protein [Paucimonas sp.]